MQLIIPSHHFQMQCEHISEFKKVYKKEKFCIIYQMSILSHIVQFRSLSKKIVRFFFSKIPHCAAFDFNPPLYMCIALLLCVNQAGIVKKLFCHLLFFSKNHKNWVNRAVLYKTVYSLHLLKRLL